MFNRRNPNHSFYLKEINNQLRLITLEPTSLYLIQIDLPIPHRREPLFLTYRGQLTQPTLSLELPERIWPIFKGLWLQIYGEEEELAPVSPKLQFEITAPVNTSKMLLQPSDLLRAVLLPHKYEVEDRTYLIE